MHTILLIEDNALILEMLTERLSSAGFHVIGASDGVQGVAQARRSRPDLILMDMGLPEMDGWQATRALRASPETAAVPIIALTAHTTGDDRDRSLLAGCNDFEPKPVNFQRLLEKMQRHIKKDHLA